MANKENNNKNKKKSNVIYIDRNKKTGSTNNKNTSNKNRVNKGTTNTKNVTSIDRNNSASSANKSKDNKRKPKSVSKGTGNISSKSNRVKDSQNKSNSSKNKTGSKNKTNSAKSKSEQTKIISNTKTKKTKTKKNGKKINWGRVAIAVVLVIALSFGGFKGVQMIKNKDSKSQVTATNKVEEDNSTTEKNNSVSKNNSTSKGQYDLEDEKNQKSKKYNIVVDAGHGGNDKGSLDSTETVYEKDIALQIAKKVASRLGRESDVNVIMTRSEDKYVSLEERAEIAKRANADALISIHLNAQKKFGDANGLETWYRGGATDGSKELASSVQKTTASYVEITSRGILRNNFEILRETTMPAVLIECGFITNVSDMEKLKNPNYQDMLAEGIMQGTLSFLDEKNQKN